MIVFAKKALIKRAQSWHVLLALRYLKHLWFLAVLLLTAADTAPRNDVQVSVVNMIPKSLSGETNQDSEPNLAVNPGNPQLIAGSAFTPDPVYGPRCPIYISSDGGSTWGLNSIIPSEAGSKTGTYDITLRFGTGTTLYAGILRLPNPAPFDQSRTIALT